MTKFSERNTVGRSREDEDRTLRSRGDSHGRSGDDFLVEGSRDTQESEWEERERVRTQELVASHDAVKLLNDESVELIKVTLPSPALTRLENNR